MKSASNFETMKNRILPSIAIVLSLGAIIHSLWLQSDVDRRIKMAVGEREKELVESAAVRLTPIYRELLSGSAIPAKPPTTIPELIEPLFQIFDALGSPANGIQSEPADNQSPREP